MTLYRPGGRGLVLLGGGLPEPDDGAHHVQGHQADPLHGGGNGARVLGDGDGVFCFLRYVLLIFLSAAVAFKTNDCRHHVSSTITSCRDDIQRLTFKMDFFEA